MMRSRCLIVAILILGIAFAPDTRAQQSRLIVRDTLGLTHLTALCPLLGCNVIRGLGDPSQQVFLVAPIGLLNLNVLVQLLLHQVGIAGIEVDQLLALVTPPLSFIPAGLYDASSINYYGANVWDGYV